MGNLPQQARSGRAALTKVQKLAQRVASQYLASLPKPTRPGITASQMRAWKRSHVGMFKRATRFVAPYSPDELWPYREYTWTRSTARPGPVRREDSTYVDLEGPSKWDFLLQQMHTHGWASKEPLHLLVDKRGQMQVAEGNHRLAIARELGLSKVSVVFEFRNSI